MSQAVSDLGLGGTLGQQVADETEEEKKRRMLGLSSMSKESPAVQALFGFGGMTGGRGY